MVTKPAATGTVRPWTQPTDIAAKIRRRWSDGSLATAHLAGRFEPIDIPIFGPKPSEIGSDLAAVRAWIDALQTGSAGGRHYELTLATVGGRTIGRNELPVRAAVTQFAQVQALLGIKAAVRKLDEIATLAAGFERIDAWVRKHPLRAIDAYDAFPGLVAAFDWLDSHRGSGTYLREITAPGIDTKFAENHRRTLAAMLGVSAGTARFLSDLGLAAKPQLVRLRPAPSLGLTQGLTEIACRVEELANLALAPRRAVIIENEITYLSTPVPDDGAVIWGSGFAVDRPGRLPWLSGADVTYWGDLDTNGFAILDRLRARLPEARSVLMDFATLDAHRDRWVTEDRPTSAALTRLTAAELDIYTGLVEDRWGTRVRLEQERIDWAWAAQRLALP